MRIIIITMLIDGKVKLCVMCISKKMIYGKKKSGVEVG